MPIENNRFIQRIYLDIITELVPKNLTPIPINKFHIGGCE
tara:strand:+ start:351 stop:470 length:120 start_codon:yes stop_codon:yes gene_type:complete